MPTRFARIAILVALALTPINAQQAGMRNSVSQKIWSRGQPMRPDSPPELDSRAVLARSIHQDVEELSALSASVQVGLQRLHQGTLAGDLDKNLRQMEKLAKRLRKELQQQ